MGRPAHEPTPESRDKVKALSAVGARHEDIALLLEISADTLTKHYRRELDLGRIEANAKMAQTLYRKGLDGNIVAAIFWLKTRAGWRETTNVEHSHRGALGSVQFTPEQLAQLPEDQLQAMLAAVSSLGAQPADE